MKALPLAAILLAGCMSQMLERHLGQPIQEAVAERGPPTSHFQTPEGGRAFLWAAQTEVQLPAQAWTTYGPTSALTTVSGGQTIRGQCIVTLFTRWNPARNAWIVERYRYSGC